MNFSEFKNYKTDKPLYAVIGDPVGHSVSPFLHRYVFEKLGVDAEYIAICVKENELDEFFSDASKKLCGFNVTIPHKTAVIKYLNHIDVKAKDMNSVNTVHVTNGQFKGYNTDINGVLDTLSYTALPLANAKVTVLGSGGAAKSVVFALRQCGADITVARREKSKACFADSMPNIKITTLDCLPETDLLINTTPVGMTGVSDKSPTDRLPDGCRYVYDVIYTPLSTPLLNLARASGVPAVNGLKMLASQATAADSIWLSCDIPQGITDGCEALLSAEVVRNRLSGRNKENILLSGFMGCGKSTVGKLLAECLDFEFADADTEIEKTAKMTVSEIFSQYGEEGFRKLESSVLGELSKKRGIVIASGGGSMVSESNFELVSGSSFVIYMQSSEDTLFKNISKSNDRPLMKTENPKNRLHELLTLRSPHYEQNCHAYVNAVGTPHEVVERIMNEI